MVPIFIGRGALRFSTSPRASARSLSTRFSATGGTQWKQETRFLSNGARSIRPKVIESRRWTDEADPVDNRSGPCVLEHVL
jgi:hypothetical protein